MVLLEQMAKTQRLDEPITNLPCIIYLEDAMYYYAYLVDETDDYLSICCLNEEGREHAKVLNKSYIQSIELMYQDTIKTPKQRVGVSMYE